MKPADVIKTHKAIVSRVDRKPWKEIIRIEPGESINQAICKYCSMVNGSTYESRVFAYAAFPHNGLGWDGCLVTFPMPKPWDWYGKQVSFSVATITHSVCF